MPQETDTSCPSDRFWKLLFQSASALQIWQDRQNPELSPRIELTHSQLQIMGCIFFSPNGKLRVKDIAEELLITPGGVSQQVENLVNLGLIERNLDENDRRAVSLSLSDSGIKIREQVDAVYGKLLKQLLRHVPEEKQKIATDVLQSLLSTLQEDRKTMLEKIEK